MKKRIPVLLLACALLLMGCAKKKPVTSDFYASSEYQNRALLQQSLFRSDQAILSNEEIETILSSRIQLSKSPSFWLPHLEQVRPAASPIRSPAPFSVTTFANATTHAPALIQAPPVRYILVPPERSVLSWAAAAVGAADT